MIYSPQDDTDLESEDVIIFRLHQDGGPICPGVGGRKQQ